MTNRYLPATARFWAKVNKTDSCWLWTGGKWPNGYGYFRNKNKFHLAHRWAYEQLVGPIPTGLVLDHVKKRGCCHKHCVNPAHLEPVSNKVNLLRGQSFSGVNSRKTCCIHGHAFTVENTIIDPLGRKCRQCSADKSRRKYWRDKARHTALLLGEVTASTTLQRAGFHAVEDDDPDAAPSDAVQRAAFDVENLGRQ